MPRGTPHGEALPCCRLPDAQTQRRVAVKPTRRPQTSSSGLRCPTGDMLQRTTPRHFLRETCGVRARP
ncbi:hypothetical protein AKJ09_09994 [Labilithrix luteola]|uniref:Uncharacterized protein n=1 Tax=Labilithrix luteola TaxID=1391654 RepID=A0A0K1QC23_9BACT|nr:hypothetical protein AKJ09_09994 [Labilithrix luteola]